MSNIKFTIDELKRILQELDAMAQPIEPMSDDEVAEIEALPPVPMEASRLQRMWKEFNDMRREVGECTNSKGKKVNE